MGAELERFIAGVKEFFRGEWINTLEVQNKKGDSDTRTIVNVQALQRLNYIDCRQRLKKTARFLRVMCTVQSNFFFVKPDMEPNEISYREPLAANVYYNFNNEDILKWRIEPSAYPVTIIWYMSG
jgi:hypothetical protein